MATQVKPLPFGISQKWIDRRDEEIAIKSQSPIAVIAARPTYDELLAKIDALQMEIDQLKAQPPRVSRKPSLSGKSRGRRTAESVVMRKGITYYSMAHVAKSAGINQSNVSRQMNKLGIKPELIGGINYIPASQASNIKRRKR